LLFSYFLFGIAGLRVALGIFIVSLPFYLIINNFDFRAKVVSSLEMVDYVTIYPEDESLYTIEHLKPDIHVKGRSVIEERIKKEKDLVESWGGRMQIFPLELGNSTSNIIKKIIETEK